MSDIKDFKIKDGVLTKYTGSDAEVVIPDGVTSIRGTAFYNCSSLMSITIPDGITSIGKSAFSFCQSLTSVIIPDSVTSIGYNAFFFCSSLESITIPASVVGIGNGTFHNCSSLTSVTIPDGIRSIGENAFSFCRGLTSITIPDSVVSIGNRAFRGCSSLQSITIPNSVKSIGFAAFEECSSLKSVIIPDSVKSIGNKAFRFYFSGYKKLSDIYFKNRKISDAYNVGNGNFDKKSLLQGYLENEAYLVESKEINDSYVEYVRGQRKRLYKFAAEYKNLLRFMIDNKIIPVEDCDAVLDVVNDNAELTAMLLDYKNSNFTFDDEIKAMNKALDKTHNPLSVSEMKKIWSFKKLDDGTLMITNYKGSDLDVVIPETIGKSKVAVIGSHAFNPYGNRVNNQDVRLNIKSITIPNSVKNISDSAFSNCSSLISVTIPNSVKNISDSAFFNCSSLISVTIPNSVTSIGKHILYATAYYNDKSNWYDGALYVSDCLVDIDDNHVKTKNLQLIDGTRVIADSLFSYSNLTSITIPNSVKNISDSAFWGCSSLTIHASAGSYAEQFAKRYQIPFEAE